MDVSPSIEGFDEIVIKNISDCIWVTRIPCPDLVFNKSDLEVPPLLRKRARITPKTEEFIPVIGKRYAVCINDKFWHRGKLVSEDKDLCEIFLIDLGQKTFVKKELLRPLPKDFEKIPPQAFCINFYGIKPVCMQSTNGFEINLEQRECSSWQPSHIMHLKIRFDNAEKVYFKEITKVNGVTFGIVMVRTSQSLIDLNDDLCKKNLAKKVENIREMSKLIVQRQETDENKSKMQKEDAKENEETMKKEIEETRIEKQKEETEDKTVKPISSPVSSESSDKNIGVNNLGRLAITSRESLLKAGFGENLIKPRQINDKLNKSANSNISEDGNNSSDCLSDSSMSERMQNTKSNQSLNEISFNEKFTPISASVLKLYEQANKTKPKMATTDQGPEKEKETKLEERRNKRNVYNRALLHQSPSITEEIVTTECLIDSEINVDIHKILDSKRLKDLTQLQTFAYPILTKRYNLVMVGNPHSGKSLAGIVSILTLLSNFEYYDDLKKGYGPKAIFLTSYAEGACEIEQRCRAFLSKRKDLTVKAAYGGDVVNRLKFELADSCDVLIVTPRSLLRILKAKFITNIDRLCHLVFDDADLIFDKFLPEIQELLTLITKLETVRNNEKYKVQKIVLAEKWTPVLEWFVKSVIVEGFVCIPTNNLLEAAVYSRIKPNIQFLKPESKPNVLKELLKSVQGTYRSVILCQNKDETMHLQKELDPICDRLLAAHEGMDHVTVASVRRAWLEHVDGLHAVIVCTDDVLTELNITNADMLIHYCLPLSKTVFSCRFMCLLEKYRNVFLKESLPLCKVHMFVDEENDEQFPEIVQLMKRLKLKISDKIENVVNRINIQKEKSKKALPLCEELKMFGSCWQAPRCHYRHIIVPEIDEVTDFPKTGHVKVKVTYEHTASHLSVILLEHKVNEQWEKLSGIEQTAIISLKMHSSFENESERLLHPDPKIGDVVAIQKDLFYRARIIDITKFDDKKAPSEVTVKLLETGEISEEKVLDLYFLANDLREIPPQAVDVYLCRLQPTDLDNCWSREAFRFTSRWVMDAIEAADCYGSTHYLSGKIVLSIGRDLWLDPLAHTEWLETTKTEMFVCNFRYNLIKNNVAIDNPDHLSLLYKLCSSAGLKLPNTTMECIKSKGRALKGQWAHINRDEFTEVYICLAENPEMIFLKRPIFADQLEELQKDINDYKRRETLQEGDLKIGDLCLAFYPDEKTWNRAKVIAFPSTDKIEVFYADYGDFGVINWDQLAKLPSHLLTKLPLQVIECRLVGLRPLNGEMWSENSASAVYNLAEYEPENWKTLLAYVFDLELQAKVTGGRRYAVALIDIESDPFVLLNKQLIIQGEANWLLEERECLNNIVAMCKDYVDSTRKENFNEDDDLYQSSKEAQDENEGRKEGKEDWDKDISTTEFNNNTSLIKSIPTLNGSVNEMNFDDDDVEVIDAKAVLQMFLNITLPDSFGSSQNQDETEPKIKELSYTESHSSNSSLDTSPSISKLSNLKPGILRLPKKKTGAPVLQAPGQVGQEVKEKKINKKKHVSQSSKVKSKEKGKTNKSSRLSSSTDCDESEMETGETIPPLKAVGCVRTPVVYWYQNEHFIWLRIMLTDVKDYYLEWTHRSLIMSALHENKYYRLDLNLYGPICKDTLQHSAKGFFVEVKMEKGVHGCDWLRLCQSKANYNWLKVNPDHIDVSSDDETQGRFAYTNKKRYNKSQPMSDLVPPCIYSDSDNSSSDAYEPDREEDPDDPFTLC